MTEGEKKMYAEFVQHEDEVLEGWMMEFSQRSQQHIVAKRILRERQAVRDAKYRAEELARHNEVIDLTKVGNKHSSDAVFWAILAAILSGIAIMFGVFAWLSPTR